MPTWNTRLFVVASGLMLLANGALACTGEACGDAKITLSNGCYYVANSGSRNIKVQLGDTKKGGMAAVTLELKPGEKKQALFFGKCFGSYVGGTSAWFVK